MSSETGYSKRSLADKLGLKVKAGQRACFVKAPAGFFDQLGPLPPGLALVENLEGLSDLDFILFFTASRAELANEFPALKAALSRQGTL